MPKPPAAPWPPRDGSPPTRRPPRPPPATSTPSPSLPAKLKKSTRRMRSAVVSLPPLGRQPVSSPPPSSNGPAGFAKKRRFIIFDGTAGAPLRAALLRRPHWVDATEDEPPDKHGTKHVEPPSGSAGQYVGATNLHPLATRNHARAVAALERQAPTFLWRHVPVEKPDRLVPNVNRWRGSGALMHKDAFLRTLSAYYEAQDLEPFRFLPLSFELPPLGTRAHQGGRPLKQAAPAFCAAHARCGRGEGGAAAAHCGRNLWLLKPAKGCGGVGIVILRELAAIEAHMRDLKQQAVQKWVAQKYLEAPLLYRGRKFDVRLWVTVRTEDSPLGLAVWAYREGYLRTSSEPYSTDDASDLAVHLTNQCVQERPHQSPSPMPPTPSCPPVSASPTCYVSLCSESTTRWAGTRRATPSRLAHWSASWGRASPYGRHAISLRLGSVETVLHLISSHLISSHLAQSPPVDGRTCYRRCSPSCATRSWPRARSCCAGYRRRGVGSMPCDAARLRRVPRRACCGDTTSW